jgi:hypothetical protein
MEVVCELQLMSGGGRVVFITDSSLAVGLKNRQWKPISTGGSVTPTASGNYIFTGSSVTPIASVNILFPLAVGLREPLVEIGFHWRFPSRAHLVFLLARGN